MSQQERLARATAALSEKQLGDAAGVYEVQSEGLDTAYLKEWIGRLGLESLWAELLRKVTR